MTVNSEYIVTCEIVFYSIYPVYVSLEFLANKVLLSGMEGWRGPTWKTRVSHLVWVFTSDLRLATVRITKPSHYRLTVFAIHIDQKCHPWELPYLSFVPTHSFRIYSSLLSFCRSSKVTILFPTPSYNVHTTLTSSFRFLFMASSSVFIILILYSFFSLPRPEVSFPALLYVPH